MSTPIRPAKINLDTPFQIWQTEFNKSVNLWNYFVTSSGEFTASGAIFTDVTVSGGYLDNPTFINSSLTFKGFEGGRFTNPTISGGSQLTTTLSGVEIVDSDFDAGPWPYQPTQTLNGVTLINPQFDTQSTSDPASSGLFLPVTTSGYMKGTVSLVYGSGYPEGVPWGDPQKYDNSSTSVMSLTTASGYKYGSVSYAGYDDHLLVSVLASGSAPLFPTFTHVAVLKIYSGGPPPNNLTLVDSYTVANCRQKYQQHHTHTVSGLFAGLISQSGLPAAGNDTLYGFFWSPGGGFGMGANPITSSGLAYNADLAYMGRNSGKLWIAICSEGTDELRTYSYILATDLWNKEGTDYTMSFGTAPDVRLTPYGLPASGNSLDRIVMFRSDDTNPRLTTYEWNETTETWSTYGNTLQLGSGTQLNGDIANIAPATISMVATDPTESGATLRVYKQEGNDWTLVSNEYMFTPGFTTSGLYRMDMVADTGSKQRLGLVQFDSTGLNSARAIRYEYSEDEYQIFNSQWNFSTFQNVKQILNSEIHDSNFSSGSTFSGVTFFGGTVDDQPNSVTITGVTVQNTPVTFNPTISGGILQSNVFNDATFGNLPTAPITTPTQSGELVTKSYIDTVAGPITLGTAAYEIPANRAIGITSSGQIKLAGLHSPGVYMPASGNVTSTNIDQIPRIVTLNNGFFVTIWQDGNDAIVVLSHSVNGVITYSDDVTISGLAVYAAVAIKDETLDIDTVAIFGRDGFSQLKQYFWYESAGLLAKLTGPDVVASGISQLAPIERNMKVPNVVGCFVRGPGVAYTIYSCKLDNGTATKFGLNDISSAFSGGLPIATADHRLRFMRPSEDSDHLFVIIPTIYNIAQTAVKTTGCPASGVVTTHEWRIANDPVTISGMTAGVKSALQWSVGNTMRMIVQSDSGGQYPPLFYEMYFTPSYGNQDSILTVRSADYAHFSATTFLRPFWFPKRINDELIAYISDYSTPDEIITMHLIHWPINGEPYVIGKSDPLTFTSTSGCVAGNDYIDNQIYFHALQDTVGVNDQMHMQIYELVYPIGVTSSVLTSGQSVTTNDILFNTATSSEVLRPGGPVYVPLAGSGQGLIVSTDQMYSQIDGMRFGRAITNTLFTVEQP